MHHRRGKRSAGFLFLSAFLFLFSEFGFAKAYTFGLLSDVQMPTETADLVRQSLIKASIKDLILVGDQQGDPNSSYDSIWGPWQQAHFKFIAVAIGNHHLGYAKEVAYFNMPGEYYEKKIDDLRFLVLNSDDAAKATEQANWLEGKLRSGKEAFTFVMFHHSPFKLSEQKIQKRTKFNEAIRPVLLHNQKKITALFFGHDHVAGLYTMAGIPAVFSAATAMPRTYLSPIHLIDHDAEISTKWLYKGDPGWTRLEVDSETNEVTFQFVDAKTDEVSCSFKLTGGTLVLSELCAR